MDNSKNTIRNFEFLLRKQSSKKPIILYNKNPNPNEETYKPQDVIKAVCTQVKALQSADCAKSGKSGIKDFSEVKSRFLPLNKLPVYGSSMQKAPKANVHKFETQCVLDTQIIDIIDGATLNTNTGMTQEFDTTFANNDDINSENPKLYRGDNNYPETDNTNDVKNKVLSVEDNIQNITKSGKSEEEIDTINHNKPEKTQEMDTNIAIANADDFININAEQNSQLSKTATEDTVTFIENLPISQEVNEKLEGIINKSKEIDMDKTLCTTEIDVDTRQDIERPPSPVLKTKGIKIRLRTPSPLVVSLDAFKNFENIAMSLIEETDFETAKYLINSQIIGKELCLNDDTKVSPEIKRDSSPVVNFESDELPIDSNELMAAQDENEVVLFQDIKSITETSSAYKDEILFSSDDEDFDQRESQNLPLTCAIETSNDQVDILDKTINVGSQITSNESTQTMIDERDKTDFNIDTEKDAENLLSQILNAETIQRKLRTPSPLIVSLETFENFENIAMSLIEETDFETAEHLINSKLLDKELCLYDNTEVLLGIERDNSPVLDFKSGELKINSYDLIPVKKANKAILLQDIEDITEKRSEVLKDEILFSSDEEDFADEEKNQNLPLTCVLERSNDQIDILDGTLYVGFQTASNKSIQISRDSYEQAQSIFRNDDGITVEEFSLTELVEQCDKIKSKPENRTSTNSVEACETKAVELKSDSNDFEDRLENNQEHKIKNHLLNSITNMKNVSIKKQSFNGFMTASHKKINMSDKALERCQKVFKDIDFDVNLRTVEVSEKLNSAVETNSCMNNPEENYTVNVEETDDKINDELLIEEFVNIAMSLEEKGSPNEHKEHVECEGFKTANKKEITISKEAIARTKNMFQGIDFNEQNNDVQNDIRNSETTVEDINQPSTSKAVFEGFRTANNKEIKISDEALSKSKDVFKDIGRDKQKLKTIEDILSEPSTSNNKFVGFKTASNRDITISNEAFSKTKNVFKDVDKEQTKNTHNHEKQPSTSKAVKFKIGDSKNVKVVDDIAVSNSKDILTKLADEMIVQYEGEEPEPAFKGFERASDKQVYTSDQTIEKNRKLFTDIMFDSTTASEVIGDSEKSINIGFKGFKTASNKAVKISEEALAKSEIFSDLDHTDSSVKTLLSIGKKSDENCIYKGFQTASKKSVTVSADALAKSKKLFKDIDNPNDTVAKNIPKITNFGSMTFQTANMKPVELNKDALVASKKLLNDLSCPTDNSRSDFVGFKTGSNKNVNISKEALAKSKKIFDDIKDISITAQQLAILETKKDIFKGFQTANKNKTEISKDGLEETKNIYDDIIDFATTETGRSFVGFQTARYNKVKISEQALARSRQLFQDLDTDSNINIPKKDNNSLSYKQHEKDVTKHAFGFKTGANKEITVSEDAPTKSKMDLAEHLKNKTGCKDQETNIDVVNVDKMIDTQVINDFDEEVGTEDFKDTSRPIKRPGSPILMCPKAKKIKKFETPYKLNTKIVTDLNKNAEVIKQTNNINFRDDYKKNKKYTLKDLTGIEKGSKDIDPYIFNFNLENILNFEFNETRNDFNKGKITIDDLKQIFTEATDKKLIPDGWLDIQLKSILWKLISYEIRFPNALGKVCSVKNVIDQLKYRYDKELYNAERSVLRKILEKDDVPNKTMVLCVAGFFADGVSVISATNINNIELLLTDGWYYVKATIDSMLSKLVYDGRIVVGSKIVTCGAELVNCEQGVAPWEDTSSIRLSIYGNSTRRAAWHERLGLRPCTMVTRLSAVRVGGGKVSRLRARVVRVYPRLYVEKFQDGSTVTRSERLEHQYQMKYEAEREAMIEKIYEEVEKEMSDQDSQDSDGMTDPSNKRKCFDSGSQIAKMMKISKDPMEFRAQLSSSQVHLLQDHASKQRDKYLRAIQDRLQERLQNRNVVTLARGRIAGLERDGDSVTVTKGMLSIWKPNDEVLDIFKEGSWMEVTNVVPTAFRNSEIQLSAGRQSVFRPVKCKEDIFNPYLISLSRSCYNLKDLSLNPCMNTDYNEIDTVGILFAIDPSNRDFDSNKNQFQNVYLADIDKNMICVNFWGGIKKFGYENVLDTGQVIYCGNLQKRAGNTRKNIPQFRATEFGIFTKTPKNEKGREMVDEINKKMLGLDRRKFCEDCVAVKQNYTVIRCLNDSENVSPYRFNNSDYNLCKNKVFIETPVVKVKKAEDFNLTGLDFESTFRQQDTQLSPKSLERKKKVNERIAKLKMYGEPPPLSSINIINKSKNATNSYKSPLLKNESEISNRAGAASVNKLEDVTTPTKLPDDIVKTDGEYPGCSPIISNISMNRTYVKRSINPVKLSFSENASENVDGTGDLFAEEFESSPPLSLE